MKIATINTVFWCLFVGTCLQSIVLLTIVIQWSRARTVNNEPKITKLCTDCENLIPRRYTNDHITSEVEKLRTSPSSQCCGESEKILRFALQKETKDMNSNCIRYTVSEAVYQKCDSYVDQTPYARSMRIKNVTRIGELSRLLWYEHREAIEGPSKLHITHIPDEGEIFIRMAGHYRVLSKLVIANNVASNYLILRHYIYVLSLKNGTRRMIAETRMSIDNQSHTNSILSSVFRFDLHDRVYVVVSHPKHIDMSSHENAFTLYKI